MFISDLLSKIPDITYQYTFQDIYFLCGRLDVMPWAPDIILLNYKLPDLDSIKTIETIKRLCPPAKIIIYSSIDEDMGAIKLLGAPGVFEYWDMHPPRLNDPSRL